MNKRGGIFTLFIFLFLSVIILLQIFSMVQSDRLYERVNFLLDMLAKGEVERAVAEKGQRVDLRGEEFAGDEGDWLVWRIGAEPATLNYVTAKDIYAGWIVVGNILESLLEYDLDKVELKPLLAEGFEISDDGLEITFRLREDVCFSDGERIASDDVIFSYQMIINPKVDAHSLANYYQPIEQVVRIDERTVKFILAEPYFKGLEIAGLMPILPKHIYEFFEPKQFNEHRSNPVGSGPFVFERWDVGHGIVLRRNERYWADKPKLEKIVFRIITNELAALQALRSHEIDFMVPTSEQFVELSHDEEFTEEFQCLSYWNPGTGYTYIGWDGNTAFFNDRRVRLAMTHLIDRESMIKHLFGGLGRVITGPFYVLGEQYDSSIEPWSYNPERAKQLLDEAGWVDSDGDGIRDKDGVVFRFKFMIVSGYLPHERLVRLLKDEMAKVGIELNPDPYEWSVFQERLNTRSFDAATLAWGGVVLQDPYQVWHSSQIERRGSNYVGFENSEADAIIEQARRTLDVQERNELYHRFHKILHKEQPYTFLRARPSIRFLDKRFKDVKIHKLGLDPEEWYVPRQEQRYK